MHCSIVLPLKVHPCQPLSKPLVSPPPLAPYPQVQIVLPDMSPDDLALALDAFHTWRHPLPGDLLKEMEELSLRKLEEAAETKRLQAENSGSNNATVISGGGVDAKLSPLALVQLLRGLVAAGYTPSRDWLRAWTGLMDTGALQSLVARTASSPHPGDSGQQLIVVQLVELLSQEGMRGMRPSTK